jgi:hypothetical protein
MASAPEQLIEPTQRRAAFYALALGLSLSAKCSRAFLLFFSAQLLLPALLLALSLRLFFSSFPLVGGAFRFLLLL